MLSLTSRYPADRQRCRRHTSQASTQTLSKNLEAENAQLKSPDGAAAAGQQRTKTDAGIYRAAVCAQHATSSSRKGSETRLDLLRSRVTRAVCTDVKNGALAERSLVKMAERKLWNDRGCGHRDGTAENADASLARNE